MNIKKKTYWISLIVLLISIALAGIIYFYTSNLIIAIFFAPPIIHWILRKKSESDY